MNKLSLKKLLWVDAIAALLSGCVVFIFTTPISNFVGLPENLLRTLSIISFIYASFSFYLASSKSHSRRLLIILVLANSLYAIACLTLALIFYKNTLPGAVYLLLESLFVAMLAALEWKAIKIYLNINPEKI